MSKQSLSHPVNVLYSTESPKPGMLYYTRNIPLARSIHLKKIKALNHNQPKALAGALHRMNTNKIKTSSTFSSLPQTSSLQFSATISDSRSQCSTSLSLPLLPKSQSLAILKITLLTLPASLSPCFSCMV